MELPTKAVASEKPVRFLLYVGVKFEIKKPTVVVQSLQ